MTSAAVRNIDGHQNAQGNDSSEEENPLMYVRVYVCKYTRVCQQEDYYIYSPHHVPNGSWPHLARHKLCGMSRVMYNYFCRGLFLWKL